MMTDLVLQSNEIPLDLESLSPAELCELVCMLHGQNAELRARIAELEARLWRKGSRPKCYGQLLR